MKFKKIKITRKAKQAFGIIVATIIVTSVLLKFLHKKETELKPQTYTEQYYAVFEYVYDGDTAVFIVDGKEVTCRFLAVDSPEIGEEGYEEAKLFTRSKLSNAAKIVLELDPKSERYDKYDRLLAWIWVDDELLQAELIKYNHSVLRYLYDDYLYIDHLQTIKSD